MSCVFSNENLAFELLYSTVTSSSLAARIPFKIFKGFLGIMNSADSFAEISSRVYLTSLWASVATKVKLSEEN